MGTDGNPIDVAAAGRRWRQLFVGYATVDRAAVRAASKRLGLPGTDLSVRTGRDPRPERRRIAERFLHIDHIGEWEEEGDPAEPLSLRSTTLVFCPGLINTLLPVRAFATAFAALEKRLRLRIVVAQAHPLRGCEANVDDLAAAIEQAPEDVFLFGYSKGAADALTLLVARPDLAERVRAIVCWGGAVGGSFIADDLYDTVREMNVPLGGLADQFVALIKAVFPVLRLERLSDRIEETDFKAALRDLTTAERARFAEQHGAEIDALGIPIFSVAGTTSALEVPAFQVQGFLEIRRRAGVNDMQVSLDQARWPGKAGVDLGTVHAHHWDMSYDPFPMHMRAGFSNLDHPFPREAAILATFTLLAELGLAQ